jgi:hypothetical protein
MKLIFPERDFGNEIIIDKNISKFIRKWHNR